MIDISPEVQILATIKPGSVYYFVEEAFPSDEPHYFIVLNNPQDVDDIALLVSSSSKVRKVKRRRRKLPKTIVEVTETEYPDFTKNSVIDCNVVIKKKVRTLIRKLKNQELEPKTEMAPEVLDQLKDATIQSPLVETETKKLLS